MLLKQNTVLLSLAGHQSVSLWLSCHPCCRHCHFSLLEGHALSKQPYHNASSQARCAAAVGAGGWPPGPTWCLCCRNAEKPEISLNAVSEATVSEDTVFRFRVDVLVWLHFGSSVITCMPLSLCPCSLLWGCSGNLVGELIRLKNNPFFPFFFCSHLWASSSG